MNHLPNLYQKMHEYLDENGILHIKFELLKQNWYTVNSRFKKDLNLQIHLHKAFFSDDRFSISVHKSFLNQTTLDLRKEKWSFLNQDFAVPPQ
jgi:hypothetical protein